MAKKSSKKAPAAPKPTLPAPETTGCYDGSGSKKGPILGVKFLDGDLLQFPANCKYHFRTVNGKGMIVVKQGAAEVAHIDHNAVKWIAGPQWIIRDKDAH